jgi:hypothetical protein
MNAIEQTLVFDLGNVRLLDLDAAHFFANCEAAGIELRRCPPLRALVDPLGKKEDHWPGNEGAVEVPRD